MGTIQAAGNIQSMIVVYPARKKGIDQKQSSPQTEERCIQGQKKMTAGEIAAVAFLWPFMMVGCSKNNGEVKETYQLSGSEIEGLVQLLKCIYQEGLNLSQAETFCSMDSYVNPRTNKKQSNPIYTLGAVISYSSIDLQDLNIKRRIADAIANKAVSWEEKGRERSIRIIKACIEKESNSGLGSAGGFDFDVVTIFPLKVLIDGKKDSNRKVEIKYPRD